MNFLRVSLLLAFCLIGPNLYSQTKFNALFGNNYTCVNYYFSPGYECIQRSARDSLFISASDYQQLGYCFVKTNPKGTLLTGDVTTCWYRYDPPTPSFAVKTAPPYGTVSFYTCGKVFPPLWWDVYMTSCVAGNGQVFVAGLRTFNDSSYYTVVNSTKHYSIYGRLGAVQDIMTARANASNFSYLYFKGSGSGNNRCIRIIPDGSRLCMLGINESLKDQVLNTTSKYEPGWGYNKFRDSTFYIMKVDTGGKKIASKCYAPAGLSANQADLMYGILRDTLRGYTTIGRYKQSGTQNYMHLMRTDSLLNVTQSTLIKHHNLYCEGVQIIKGTSDYIVLGNYKDSSGTWVPVIISINPVTLAKNWAYSYPLSSSSGTPRLDARAWNVIRTSAGDYVMVGTSAPGLFMARISTIGMVTWTKAYGGQRGYSVIETSDHGFAAAGARYRCEQKSQDLSIYCVRTDANGNDSCGAGSLFCPLFNGYQTRDTVLAMDTTGETIAGYTINMADKEHCVSGGPLEKWSVCPECCFDPYDQLVKMVDTSVQCIGDTFIMQGKKTNLYRYQWYVNGELAGTDSIFKYVFKASGNYTFRIKIIQKNNPKCILWGCAEAFIYPGHQGFTYQKLPGDTIQLVYNDTAFTHEFYSKWEFDDGTPAVIVNNPHDAPANQQSPRKHLSVGLHKVCHTVRTGVPYRYCEYTICQDICIKSINHDCCNCE